MRTSAALVLVLWLSLSCGPGAAADGSGASSDPGPRLRFTQLYPLTVVGRGFHGRERVQVRLSGTGAAFGRTVVADRRGRFVTRFRIRLPRCGSLAVRATGNTGSRAVREVPRPSCREP